MRLHDEGRELLKELMQVRKDSFRTVARAAGWNSHSFLHRLLEGTATSVSPQSAVLLAKHFAMPVHRFFVTESLHDVERTDPQDASRKVA